MRRVCCPGRPVDEERLIGHQCLLLADPLDRVVGHVLGEVVALLGGAVGLHRDGVVVDRRVVLVGLTPDEAVKVLEPAAGRPLPERPHRAGLPHRHLVALTELGGRIAVEFEDLRQRGRGIRPDRVVAGCRRRELGDGAHPHRVVIAPGEKRLAGRRTQRRGVEPVVLQARTGQPLGRRCLARAAEGRRGAETDVVDQGDDHVRRARRRAHRLDRGKITTRIGRGVPVSDRGGPVRDRQDYTTGGIKGHETRVEARGRRGWTSGGLLATPSRVGRSWSAAGRTRLGLVHGRCRACWRCSVRAGLR